MNKVIIYSSLLLIAGAVSIPVVFSDRNHYLDSYKRDSIGVAKVDNPIYQEECGSCHMGYQPGLLTSASWEKIINGLEDHFGDNAELDASTQQMLSEYLMANSAETSNYRRSKKFMRNINLKNAPIRITKTPYFIHKHDEIPDKLVRANQQIKSFSNCNACHNKAEQGLFDEHGVNIPGYGRWED
ncbi:MAG: diheme cytochrome c [Pseudomonadota bacterium]